MSSPSNHAETESSTTQAVNTEQQQQQQSESKASVISPMEDEETESLELALKEKKKKKKKKTEKTEAEVEESISTSTSANGISPSEISPPPAADAEDYTYMDMLSRVYSLLHDLNPNLTQRKRHVMPPPQLVRVGTRKTMWQNYLIICQTMHRSQEHVSQFLFAELGTEGSIDGMKRLIIKGRYSPKQIESLLKKYIVEYVTCHMCKNPETTLTRDSVTRLYFLQCESCGSRRSVAPIKSGFHATMRTDRRKVKEAA